MEVAFNLRFSTEQTATGLEAEIGQLLDAAGLRYELQWALSGEPFQTARQPMIAAVSDSVAAVQPFRPEASTGGGTSDGRFIARLGSQIVELGPVNRTIHSVNECTSIPDLEKLCRMFRGVLERILLPTRDA